MSVALPFAGLGTVSRSVTESDAFGFGVARLSIGGQWAADIPDPAELVRAVASALHEEPADTVIVRFPSELVGVAMASATTGRRLQHAGTLLYWEDVLLSAEVDAVASTARVSPVGAKPRADFVREAVSVIADSFEGYLNHYGYNDRIPLSVARDGYVDWTRRTIGDPDGLGIVLLEDGAPVAAATVRIHDEGVAEVELAGVVTSAQGSGRYGQLWREIRSAVRDARAERLIISTQSSNIRVQKAWARLGLLPLASFDTVHAAR